MPCTQGVKGSTPFTSTKSYEVFRSFFYLCVQCGLQLDYESHRSKAMTFEQRIIKLNQINIGWINYY
ncbi:group II intron maturase-specific domain-containing protein [Clostridium sp.]|uniref:group II intron maturase-specific domain-containing protein n=1 Tax=Clostridium sp. TaxID=1506 RepID=UPI003454DD03